MAKNCILYLTGYPSSGKLTLAKKLKESYPDKFELVDSHSLSNIVYNRASGKENIEHDTFKDCAELAKTFSSNEQEYKQLFSALKSIAKDSYNLSHLDISAGDKPQEEHYQKIEQIRDLVFESIKQNDDKSYIFTNKLYDGNKHHDALIQSVKELCDENRAFVGIKLEVNVDELEKRVANSDRQSKGKLTDISKLKTEVDNYNLTKDEDFVSVKVQPTVDRTMLTVLGHIGQKLDAPIVNRGNDILER